MDKKNFTNEVQGAWRVLNERLHIGRQIIWAGPLEVDLEFRDAALDPDTSYSELYNIGLSRSHYNILLNDYAYLQFSLQDSDAWRLAYYPNPWISGVPSAMLKARELESYETEGLLSSEDTAALFQEMPYHGAIPLIRFEYAPRDYKEMAHPAAHFHIGMHTDNRWSCARKLRPLSFSLLIAKLYYSSLWASCSAFHSSSVLDCLDQKLIKSVTNDGVVHQFSSNERASPHVSSNTP